MQGQLQHATPVRAQALLACMQTMPAERPLQAVQQLRAFSSPSAMGSSADGSPAAGTTSSAVLDGKTSASQAENDDEQRHAGDSDLSGESDSDDACMSGESHSDDIAFTEAERGDEHDAELERWKAFEHWGENPVQLPGVDLALNCLGFNTVNQWDVDVAWLMQVAHQRAILHMNMCLVPCREQSPVSVEVFGCFTDVLSVPCCSRRVLF